jgi:hypothetical protein
MTPSLNQYCPVEIFACARRWLTETGGHGEDESPCLRDLFTALLGVWLCERAVSARNASPALRDLVEKVVNRLRNQAEVGSFDPFAYDAKLLLMCHRILVPFGYRATPIDAFASQVAAALRANGDIPPRYIGEALLLSQVGHEISIPAPVALPRETAGAPLDLLLADGQGLRRISDEISWATHFGRDRFKAAPEVHNQLQRILTVVLLQSLRDYDLEMAAILLRAVCYLGQPADHTLSEAVAFIVNQQRADGRFGYLAVEIEGLRRASGVDAFDASGKVYLPVTVSCVWSLAEATLPGFRLFSGPLEARREGSQTNRRIKRQPASRIFKSAGGAK